MSDIKKLCVVTTIESTMESFVIPAMRYFVEQGYHVTLICNMTPSFIDKYSVEFNLIPVKMERGFSLKDMLIKPFQLYRIFRREKFDYIQYATTNAAWYASFAAWMARVPVRVNCLWGLLYTASSGLKRKLFWLAEKVPCLFSNNFTVASHKNMEIAIADKLCSRSKASVIGAGGTVGVDVNIFDCTKRVEYSASIYEKYPILKGKTVFGYVGRIDVDKGINELIEAFCRLNNEFSNTRLILVGHFESEIDPISKTSNNAIKANNSIEFVGYQNDIRPWLAASDVFVFPSYREGFPNVVIEAGAMGVPSIVTDINGSREIIINNENGCIIPPQDSNALYEMMKKFLLNNDQTLRMASNARSLIENRFEQSFVRNCQLNYYKSLLKNL